MYRDEPKIIVHPIPDDESEIGFINKFVYQNEIKNILRIGFDILHWRAVKAVSTGNPSGESVTFDRFFYEQAGIPYDVRWSNFHIVRDPERENAVIEALNPDGEPFIFVHDDPDRGFTLPITHDKKVIRNDKRFDLFDYIGLFERADEIHCMESSFRPLIEHAVNSSRQQLYLHLDVRKYSEFLISGARKPWIRVA